MEHDWHTPDCSDECYGCMWCGGGLELCRKCGAFEGATPDECPQKPIDWQMADLVYKGIINFRDGNWYGECAQVMRPVYDLDNYMAEHGYIRDGVNNAGNPKWSKIENGTDSVPVPIHEASLPGSINRNEGCPPA